MERDPFNDAFDRAVSYQPFDHETEAQPTINADGVLEALPEDATSVSSAPLPWATVNWDGAHGVPDVDFPIVESIAAQDWFGGSEMDVWRTRAERYGTPFFGEQLDNLPDFQPTAEQITETANRWNLDRRYYDYLAGARSEMDMDVLAEAYASRNVREQAIGEATPGLVGLVTRIGVNAFDPAFVVSGGTAGTVLKVGAGATRTANALRAAGAGLAGDAPFELARQHLDPAVTWQMTALSLLASTGLSGALGSLGRGVSSSEVSAIDDAAADSIDYFASYGSSVGAAQSRPILREIDDGSGAFEAVDAPGRLEIKVPFTDIGVGQFGTPLNFLGRSVDSITRDLAARFSWNPYLQGGQQSTAFTAQRRIYEAGGAFLRQHEDAAKGYLRDRNQLAPTGGISTTQRQQFNTLVAQVLTGVRQSEDPNVLRAVKVWSDFHEDTLAFVKNEFHNGPGATGGQGRGLEEFADIEHDKSYLMRAFSDDGFRRVQNTLGGNDKVAVQLARVILRSNQEWLAGLAEKWNKGRANTPDATGRIAAPMTADWMAQRLAKKYVETVERLTNPAMRGEHSPHRPVTKADRDAARELARQSFNDGDEFGDNVEEAIDMIMDLLAPARKGGTESPRTRHRMTLNLDAKEDAAILDMFDWDVERLGVTYRRQLSGFAGLLRAGFGSTREVDGMIEKVVQNSAGKSARRQRLAAKEAEMLGHMRDMILGRSRPSLFKSETYNFIMNQIRRLNFGNLMSNVGFLAASELGGALTRVGPIRLFKEFPAFRRYYALARKGDPEATKSLYHLADAINGHGSQQLLSRLSGRVDRYEGDFEDLIDPQTRLQERVDTFTRKQANATARFSGMAPLSEYLRMTITVSEAQDWLKAARAGRPIYSARRLSIMGVDEPMWNRISAQLRKMDDARSPDTGQQVPEFDLSRWDDPEALNVFIEALDRNSRRLVLEGDLGHQALIMRRSPAMQLLFQFLGFPLNAFSKHLGFALNARDMRAVAETLAMSFGGAIGFMARVASQAAAIPDEREREAFLEERWTMEEMAKAAFYYSAHASLIPNLIDLPLSAAEQAGFDVDPIFSKARASGLAGDPLMGNASRTRFYNMLRSAGDLATGTPLSEQDMQELATAWAPMGNHVLVQAFLNRALSGLPQETEDDS
jgi:hypothetical protein